MFARAAFLAAILPAVAAGCKEAKTCGECVGSPDCGWCQPGPIIYANGSIGSRCGDNSDKSNWKCPGSYTTDKCTVCPPRSPRCPCLPPPWRG